MKKKKNSYWEVSRIRLVDDTGASLSAIVETNGYSWKLLMEHEKDGGVARSDFWSFMDLSRAQTYQQQKIEEALLMGWKRPDEVRREQ